MSDTGEPCAECLACQATLVSAIVNDNMRGLLVHALIQAAIATAQEVVDGDIGDEQESALNFIRATLTTSNILDPEMTPPALRWLAEVGVIIEQGEG